MIVRLVTSTLPLLVSSARFRASISTSSSMGLTIPAPTALGNNLRLDKDLSDVFLDWTLFVSGGEVFNVYKVTSKGVIPAPSLVERIADALAGETHVDTGGLDATSETRFYIVRSANDCGQEEAP